MRNGLIEMPRQLELGEGAAQGLRHMLEGAAIIDDDGLGVDPGKARGQVLKQHRLARAGLARDRDIVVAGIVLEGRPELGLTAPPDEEQVRDRPAIVFALDGASAATLAESTVRKRRIRMRSRDRPSASVSGKEASSPPVWR
jgi:hypothetical protein